MSTERASMLGPERVAIARLPRKESAHVLRNLGAVLALLFLAFVLQGLARNPGFAWPTVRHYMFSSRVLEGLGRTVLLTIYSVVIAITLGTVLANMRLSANPILRWLAGSYVWFFRAIPLLVLLIFTFNFSVLYPRITVGIPFGPSFFGFGTIGTITSFWLAVIAFGLQQAAYTSEVIRAALLSVPKGQREAAMSIGMTPKKALIRVVLPQAMRVAVPPIANETINLLKATALVAFISVPDLLYTVEQIYAQNFDVVPLLTVAAIWYIAVVSLMSLAQAAIERKMRSSLHHKRRVSAGTVMPLQEETV